MAGQWHTARVLLLYVADAVLRTLKVSESSCLTRVHSGLTQAAQSCDLLRVHGAHHFPPQPKQWCAQEEIIETGCKIGIFRLSKA